MTVIEPATDEAWRGLTPALFEVKPGPEGVVMVIGPRGEPPGMLWGLGLLNQRRDSMGRHLGCPVLWCGPWAFLDATWRAAPDLWSVADIPKRLEVPERDAPLYPLEWIEPSGTLNLFLVQAARMAGKSDFQAARMSLEWFGQRRDVVSHPVAALWRCRLDLMTGHVRSEHLEALRTGWSTLGPEWRMRADAKLTIGEIRQINGDSRGALRACGIALARFKHSSDRFGGAHAHRALGHICVRIREPAMAEEHYGAALATFRHFSERRGEAHVLRGLGDLRLVTDRFTEARELYRQALAIYRDIGDRLGEANAQRSLGDLSALLEEVPSAEAAYQEALRLYREIGVPAGERVTAERLAALAGESTPPS
ncbi:MAG TPA: tetratricopeptide repeat protein [Candidatus Nanopelagicales bacterium]|nr:tetratricopeptide repeat protein [Candidatus Nanopelagicales bacterium]